MIKVILSFLLGVGIGMILMSCIVISKESEKHEKNKKNK